MENYGTRCLCRQDLSPDGEWTVEIDPVSSVNTSVSLSEKFIHVVVYIVQARFIYVVYIRFCFTEGNQTG